MSSVLVIIIIPDKNYEEEVREREKLTTRLNKNKKDLKTISEFEENDNKYPIEKIVEDGLSYLGIVDATWQKSKNDLYYTVTFPVDLEDSDVVIQYFKDLGIGLKLDTSIGIIPFSLFCYNEELSDLMDQEIILENGEKDLSKSMGNFKEKQSKFIKSVTARLTVAQVVGNVRNNATLTFDFMCFVLFASWIAAMGLLDNSLISLVASMLVSPMMGPLMAITFGTVIMDGSLIKMGIRNILICFSIAISFGYIFGLIALNFTEQWSSETAWPTDMMRERGLLRVAWVGTLVAFPSGCAVAISLLQGNESSLVGVAISVSLLPPNVNAGLLWAYATLKGFYSIGQNVVEYTSQLTNSTILLNEALIPDPKYSVVYSDNVAIESVVLGFVSILFSVVNITNIFIGALLLLKIKEIAPLATLSPENRRFFQEDIKIAREYNVKTDKGIEDIGEEVLNEWANIAGLDKTEFLKPESRAVQMQTLEDIAKDVEADKLYQTVTKNVNPNENLARRLSYSVNHFIKNDALRRSFRSSKSPSPQFLISDLDSGMRRPSSAGGRRRISTVALNNYYDKDKDDKDNSSDGRSPLSQSGIANTAFTFNDAEVVNHNQQLAYERNRRTSSALLRRTLQKTEHSPYSMWPSTRHSIVTSMDKKFSVTPVNDTGMTRLSISQLGKFD